MKKHLLLFILLSPLFLYGSEEQNIIDSALKIIQEQGFADEVENVGEKKFLLKGRDFEKYGEVFLSEIYITTPEYTFDDKYTKQASLTWEFLDLEDEDYGHAIYDFQNRLSLLWFDSEDQSWGPFDESTIEDSFYIMDWSSWALLIFAFVVIAVSFVGGALQSRKSKKLLKDAQTLQEQEKENISKANELLESSQEATKKQTQLLEEMNQHLEEIKEQLKANKTG